MHTFRTIERQIGMVPASVARMLGAIDLARGREEAFRERHPEALKTLIEIARIQSTEASNAIEQVTAPHQRIRALVAEKTTPRDRAEEEIAGYRAVLDTIHAGAQHIPFKPSVVEQLHRDLYQFTGVPAGRWKTVENSISEDAGNGTTIVRFKTVSAAETPRAMDDLHERLGVAWDDDQHHRLLLVGCYVFDFLAVHPFRDGNGRMSRLLTLLLLYQAGYEVGRFISLERIVNDSKESYYDALQAAGHGWHEERHDITPWLRYFLGVVAVAHGEFEARVGSISGRGAKSAAIRQFIRSSISEEFTVAEVRRAAGGASDSYINKTLAKLRDQGIIESLGTGRGARWRRLRDDF